MTNSDILKIAMEQSAIDCGCRAEDFCGNHPVIVRSVKNENARRYLKLPHSCNLVSYGSNVVASVSEETEETVREYLGKFPPEHCFETPDINFLSERIAPLGLKICFMAEYFLPDIDALKVIECGFETKILHHDDFSELYLPEWSNALCKERAELDALGVGAYDNGQLIALAGASADCESMWQIGIDVLPQYRRRGIAAALTSRLAAEILKRGKVPFYCAAWCNIPSVRNAVKSGFRPSWVELTAKNADFVDKII